MAFIRKIKQKNLLVLGFFLVTASVLFYQFLILGRVPVPADILIGHYYPLKDVTWQGRVAGYPIKNFLLFDGIRQTLPWRLLAIEQIKKGNFPFWNSYNLGGTPLLANLQTAAFYPLNLIFLIADQFSAWGIYIFLQPVLAGCFSFVFLNSLGLNFFASIFGSVSFAFSGMMLNHLEFGIDGHSSLWLPLLLYGINLIFSNKYRKGFFLIIFSLVCNLLAGYPPIIIYNLLASFLWLLIKITEKREIFKVFLVAISIGLSFLIASPQILPSLELAQKVERRSEFFGQQSGEAHFFPYENLLMMIAPDFFGHPSTGNFFSKINYTDSPYIGFWGLVFAFGGIFIALKHKEAFYGLLISAATLFLMLPTAPAIILRKVPIPFLSSVSPMRMLWLTGFSISLLSAYGLDYFLIKGGIRLFKRVVVLGIALILIAISWYFSCLISLPSHQAISRHNLFVPTLICGAGILIVVLTTIFSKKVRKLMEIEKMAMILVLVFELLRQGFKYNPFVEKSLVYPQTEILRFLSSRPATERVLITHQEILPANSNIPYGYSTLDGYYSIYDKRAAQMASLTNALIDLKEIGGFPRIVYLSSPEGKIIDLMNITWIMALEEQKDPKLQLVMKEGKTLLYKNIKSFPKVFSVSNYLIGENDLDIARKMLRNDLSQTVILDKEPSIKKISQGGKLELGLYQSGLFEIESNSLNDYLAVISENYYPGWQAFIDGKKTEIMRANYNLMAMVIPAGSHKVRLSFLPEIFYLGLKLCLLGIGLVIGVYHWLTKIDEKKD